MRHVRESEEDGRRGSTGFHLMPRWRPSRLGIQTLTALHYTAPHCTLHCTAPRYTYIVCFHARVEFDAGTSADTQPHCLDQSTFSLPLLSSSLSIHASCCDSPDDALTPVPASSRLASAPPTLSPPQSGVCSCSCTCTCTCVGVCVWCAHLT